MATSALLRQELLYNRARVDDLDASVGGPDLEKETGTFTTGVDTPIITSTSGTTEVTSTMIVDQIEDSLGDPYAKVSQLGGGGGVQNPLTEDLDAAGYNIDGAGTVSADTVDTGAGDDRTRITPGFVICNDPTFARVQIAATSGTAQVQLKAAGGGVNGFFRMDDTGHVEVDTDSGEFRLKSAGVLCATATETAFVLDKTLDGAGNVATNLQGFLSDQADTTTAFKVTAAEFDGEVIVAGTLDVGCMGVREPLMSFQASAADVSGGTNETTGAEIGQFMLVDWAGPEPTKLLHSVSIPFDPSTNAGRDYTIRIRTGPNEIWDIGGNGDLNAAQVVAHTFPVFTCGADPSPEFVVPDLTNVVLTKGEYVAFSVEGVSQSYKYRKSDDTNPFAAGARSDRRVTGQNQQRDFTLWELRTRCGGVPLLSVNDTDGVKAHLGIDTPSIGNSVGSLALTGTTVTDSIEDSLGNPYLTSVTAPAGDNMGDHLATQDVIMNANSILGADTVSSDQFTAIAGGTGYQAQVTNTVDTGSALVKLKDAHYAGTVDAGTVSATTVNAAGITMTGDVAMGTNDINAAGTINATTVNAGSLGSGGGAVDLLNTLDGGDVRQIIGMSSIQSAFVRGLGSGDDLSLQAIGGADIVLYAATIRASADNAVTAGTGTHAYSDVYTYTVRGPSGGSGVSLDGDWMPLVDGNGNVGTGSKRFSGAAFLNAPVIGSDITKKTNIVDVPVAASWELLDALPQAISYNWVDGFCQGDDGCRHVSWSAQAVETAIAGVDTLVNDNLVSKAVWTQALIDALSPEALAAIEVPPVVGELVVGSYGLVPTELVPHLVATIKDLNARQAADFATSQAQIALLWNKIDELTPLHAEVADLP